MKNQSIHKKIQGTKRTPPNISKRKTQKIQNKIKRTPTHLRVFTPADYHSNDGMLTTVWGPGIWHFLHTMSFNYPIHPTPENKIQYRDFILSLGNVLPCGKCRNNLKNNLKKYPLKMSAMESRDTFSKYIYQLHEVVNTMLNKKSGLSYDEVRERYENFRARCTIEVDAVKKDASAPVENGCVEPLYGEKSKCLLHIVPVNKKCNTLTIDEKCIKKRLISSVI